MPDLQELAKYFSDNDTDVIIYAGGIDRSGYENFCKEIPAHRKKKLILVLVTYGGDPSAGYRIARAAIHNYDCENFTILIPTYCKSAGTLICIGAHNLLMCDKSELGPLDVQFRKQDEIFQNSSGLDILRGITYLQNEALESFKSYLLDINGGSGLSTKIASEICSKLVIGLYEPLLAQIDPVKLGEMNAALQIANNYGSRLNDKSKSLKSNALAKLINDYPTHGFVIDRAESKTLFERVSKPNEMEQQLADFASNVVWRKVRGDKPIVLDFVTAFYTTNNEEEENEHSGVSTVHAAGDGVTSNDNNSTTGIDEKSEGVNDNEQPPKGGGGGNKKSNSKRPSPKIANK